MSDKPCDGVQAMVPRGQMDAAARKVRDTYACTPGIALYKREFGYYSLKAWEEQGMPQDVPLAELFDFDPPGAHHLAELGWTVAAFCPQFEDVVLEDRGDHEVVQDHAGRHVLFFKGRRSGFMPEYLDHPVKDMETFEEKVRWRLDPETPERWADLDERMAEARAQAARGLIVSQRVIGGYMYLRNVQIDTDGDARPAIPVYQEAIGMDAMSPFEVASGCDVVEIGRQYPGLMMGGGIDKRVLAQGREAIDRHLEYIIPTMRERGGYVPMCDHGVPAEVPYEDYVYYRKRVVELGGG